MALQLILAATLRKYVNGYDPLSGHSMEIQPGINVKELTEKLEIPEEEVKLIMVNGIAAKWGTLLQGDERVALFPPVGGG
jgi:sulfur carrier protein ThiS